MTHSRHLRTSFTRTKILGLAAIGFGVWLANAVPVFADGDPNVLKPFGHAPLCEASATATVRCPMSVREGNGMCLLVGDNEAKDRLFVFPLEADGPSIRIGEQHDFVMRDAEDGDGFKVSDIEAIVPRVDGNLMIFGSHSRNKHCEKKGNRRRFAEGVLSAASFKATRRKRGWPDPAEVCQGLFEHTDNAVAKRICQAIRQSEVLADEELETGKDEACKPVPSFNLEGAVTLTENFEDVRVWVGLRAPLVDGYAILLRQVASREEFRFDGFALLDLGGNGVRDMALHKGDVWIIAGPKVDAEKEHVLWRVSAEAVRDGRILRPGRVGSLPMRSEGLAIHDRHMIVLVDGDKAPDHAPDMCTVSSSYIVRTLQD